MITNILLALILSLQSCDSCGTESQVGSQYDQQSAGIASVIAELETQIKVLTADMERKPHISADLHKDQQVAVVDLADSMSESELITRTYLALAIAELELINLAERTGRFESVKHTKLLRHAEAVSLAIDERVLEKFDLRVFRSLQAGVNQAIRAEIMRLSRPSELFGSNQYVQTIPVSNCRTTGGTIRTEGCASRYTWYNTPPRPTLLGCWKRF